MGRLINFSIDRMERSSSTLVVADEAILRKKFEALRGSMDERVTRLSTLALLLVRPVPKTASTSQGAVMVGSSSSIDQLVQRMVARGIASLQDLQGCSKEEIEQLERRYSVNLPGVYRHFLETMGRNSGRLFRYDHLVATYEYVLELTDAERKEAKDTGGDALNRINDILGDDGLIVLGRLGEQFLFVHSAQGDGSQVYYFNNTTWETRRAYSSVIEWLNAVCDECIWALESGYFDKYPSGASP